MMKLFLVGCGCAEQTLTVEGLRALAEAQLLIGAKRLLDDYEHISAAWFQAPGQLPAVLENRPDRQQKLEEYRPAVIARILKDRKEQTVSVLLSGDSGFYSAAGKLLEELKSEKWVETEVIPGISSLQYLAARLGQPWHNWRLCSAHGVDCDPVYEVMQGKPAFFLTSGSESPAQLCAVLTEAGLGTLSVTVGEMIGYPEERIRTGTAEEFTNATFASLNVCLVQAAPVCERRTGGWPDDHFRRGKVPMTKQEVRAVALAKLGVKATDVCWDIGAGTGSVSVELALLCKSVWAVEQEEEAYRLIQSNREKFFAWNLHTVKGTAPEAMDGFPRPDAVFVGGSGGRLREILAAVLAANPGVRLCVSAITLETMQEACRYLKAAGYSPQVTQVCVNRTKEAGEHQLLLAQNPVFLITNGVS